MYIYKIYFAENEKQDICIYILTARLVCVKSKTRNNK